MTVRRNNIVTKWGGKLIVDELVELNDDRGWLTELWRSDDEIVSYDDNPVQCYSSLTRPFVMRGPHEHENQTDYFVTTYHEMLYEFFDMETKEFFKYKTRADAITRLKVAPGVVHGYRNIGQTNTITHNFTSSLFGGYKREEQVDEIRHEETCHDKKKVLIIFGATGRLGSALVDAAYDHIGFYDYEIIPLYNRLGGMEQTWQLMDQIKQVISDDKEVFFINAAGCTDTTSGRSYEMTWTNSELPLVFATKCQDYGWNFIQFSSDYIFEYTNKYNVTLSPYTVSKQRMEKQIRESNTPAVLVRVANLFSDKEDDLRNMIQKFRTKVRLGEKFVIDPRVVVSPTDVKVLADYLVDTIVNDREDSPRFRSDKLKAVNILPENTYTLKEFINKYYNGYDNIEEKESLLEPWFDKFNSADSIKIPSSESTIINTLKRTKQSTKEN